MGVPFVHVRESPEFHDLLLMDRSTWPRCLLWHGWLPALACSGGARLERMLGPYSESAGREWVPSDRFLAGLAASEELLPPGNLGDERCVLFDSVRGPLQSVERAELWEGRGGHPCIAVLLCCSSGC